MFRFDLLWFGLVWACAYFRVCVLFACFLRVFCVHSDCEEGAGVHVSGHLLSPKSRCHSIREIKRRVEGARVSQNGS